MTASVLKSLAAAAVVCAPAAAAGATLAQPKDHLAQARSIHDAVKGAR